MYEYTVALLSFLGTLVGTLGGILAANRLTNYRLMQLEKKVAQHNNLVLRMVSVEQSVKSAHHRIDELKEEMHYGG